METKTSSWRNDNDFDSFSFGEILCALCACAILIAVFAIAGTIDYKTTHSTTTTQIVQK